MLNHGEIAVLEFCNRRKSIVIYVSALDVTQNKRSTSVSLHPEADAKGANGIVEVGQGGVTVFSTKEEQ